MSKIMATKKLLPHISYFDKICLTFAGLWMPSVRQDIR